MRTAIIALSLALALSAAGEESPMIDLIVRFRAPSTGMGARAVSARSVAIDARVADLRRDLDRLAGSRRGLSANAVSAAGAPRIRRTFHRTFFGAGVRVPRELRASIAALPYVATVQEARTLKPLLYESVPHIRADKVWSSTGMRGAGVVVAVIDSGIDYNHVALGGGFGTNHKVIGGWDFVDDDADPMDSFGNGTFLAGIVAGDGDGLLGVAPDASLLAYRVTDYIRIDETDILAAIERAVDPDQNGDLSDHADIAIMSLDGVSIDDDPLVEAIESATKAGVLFCVAAGNDGDYGNLGTPATAPSAISAGASDDQDAVTDFSSRGPSLDFGIKPEIVAPGVAIGSTWLGGDYVERDGTSASAAHVAGVAALVKSLHRDWTPAEIKSAIVATSVPLDQDVMTAGAGRVDALNAATATTLVTPPFVNFGQENPTIAVWSSSRDVTLRNVSPNVQTYTAGVRGARAGIAVSVTPPAITLAPGESATVTIGVQVTNRDAPKRLQGSMSYGGQIEWSGGEAPFHVPWAFVEGGFVRVDVPDAFNWMEVSFLSAAKQRDDGVYAGFARAFFGYEPVDVVVQYPWGFVFAEQVDPFAHPRLQVDGSSAQYQIETETTGEKGQRLSAPEGLCVERFALAFASGRKFSFGQTPGGRRLLGPLSQRVKVHPMHSCADVEHATMYTALHPPFSGLSSNVISTLHPQWLRQDIQFDARDGDLISAASLMRFRGEKETSFLDGGWSFILQPIGPQLTFYYTGSPSPELDLVTMTERYGHCYEPKLGSEVGCRLLGNLVLYLNGADVTLENSIHRDDFSPMAYRVPSGSPLVLGTAPVWPAVSFARSNSYWHAGTTWFGSLGEERSDDTRQAVTLVRDASGTIVGDSSKEVIGGQQILPHGMYSIESVNANYRINGAKATATVNASIDTTRGDASLPSFTGLRIEDANGRQVSVVGRDAPASLVFSITDFHSEGTRFLQKPPREDATRVEYRPSGSSEWRTLTPLIEAHAYQNNQYPYGGDGTTWRVDLSPVTRSWSGYADFRIHAEDDAGNEITLRLEPALFIGGDPKRRSTRH
jgi:subtilisin family serine protease